MSGNARLIEFLSGTCPDSEGRRLNDIVAWPDERLEHVHDFIQWLFPLVEPSPVNPSAPVLDAATTAALRAQPEALANLRAAYRRMLRFYRGSRHWITPGNHNHLRITRILKCLRLTGLDAEAQEFFEWLSAIYEHERVKSKPGITARSYEFWKDAAGNLSAYPDRAGPHPQARDPRP